jgi:hypothetical protein
MGSNNREPGRSTPLPPAKIIAIGSITLLAALTLIIYAITKDATILEFCRWVIVFVVLMTVSSAKELVQTMKDLLRHFLHL